MEDVNVGHARESGAPVHGSIDRAELVGFHVEVLSAAALARAAHVRDWDEYDGGYVHSLRTTFHRTLSDSSTLKVRQWLVVPLCLFRSIILAHFACQDNGRPVTPHPPCGCKLSDLPHAREEADRLRCIVLVHREVTPQQHCASGRLKEVEHRARRGERLRRGHCSLAKGEHADGEGAFAEQAKDLFSRKAQ